MYKLNYLELSVLTVCGNVNHLNGYKFWNVKKQCHKLIQTEYLISSSLSSYNKYLVMIDKYKISKSIDWAYCT